MSDCTQATREDEVFEPTVMGGLMHVLISILLILGFIFVLLFGTMSVLHDLVARSLQQPPPQFDADGGQHQELASVGEPAAAMPISQVPER
jgi:hypothetical protein